MHWVGGIAGAVLGLMLAEWNNDAYALGLVSGALLGILVAEVLALRTRLSRLEAMSRPPAAPATAVRPPPAVTPKPAAPVPAAQQQPFEPATAAPVKPALPIKREPSLWQRGLRWLLSGNVPVKLGVLVSFFGVAFLLKYAADQGWLSVPVELKLAGVAAFGMALLFIGWRLRSRQRVYALSVQGGGIGVLYLTIFAAFRLFDVLPAGFAFALLIVLVLGASLLAWLQRAQALAVLGSVGGFLAPLLISTGSGNHVALFSYYSLLNLAVFGLAWFTRWRWQNLIAFFFTFGVGTVWGWNYYKPALFASTEPFLVFNFILYTGIAVLYGMRAPARLKGVVDGTLVFGTPIVCFPLQAALLDGNVFGLAFSALIAALVYVAFAMLLLRAARAHGRVLFEAFLALAVAFATIAVPLALSAQWTSATWGLEGAALIWLGCRQARVLPRLAGFVLLLASGVAYLPNVSPATTAWPLLNGAFLGGALLAAAAYAGAAWMWRQPAGYTRVLGAILYGWGLLWWLVTGVVQCAEFVPDRHLFDALVGLLAVVQALNLWLARRYGHFLFAVSWYGYLPVLAMCALAAVGGRELPLATFGWLAWPCALWVHYRGAAEALPGKTWREILCGAGLWLVALLLADEVYGWFVRELHVATIWGVSAAMAVVALLAEGGERLAVRRTEPFWRTVGAAPLLGALLLWVLLVNPALAGNPVPLPYLPLLNPLDLMSIITVLLIWRAVRNAAWLAHNSRILVAAAAVAGLFLLTCMLARAVHHLGGVPFDWHVLNRSVLYQAALSITWALAGLGGMIAGARYRQRLIWYGGAGLMGIVVLKLFLIDLGNSGTVERIISFIGVGLLLLVVGYLAPAPGHKKSSAASHGATKEQ